MAFPPPSHPASRGLAQTIGDQFHVDPRRGILGNVASNLGGAVGMMRERDADRLSAYKMQRALADYNGRPQPIDLAGIPQSRHPWVHGQLPWGETLPFGKAASIGALAGRLATPLINKATPLLARAGQAAIQRAPIAARSVAGLAGDQKFFGPATRALPIRAAIGTSNMARAAWRPNIPYVRPIASVANKSLVGYAGYQAGRNVYDATRSAVRDPIIESATQAGLPTPAATQLADRTWRNAPGLAWDAIKPDVFRSKTTAVDDAVRAAAVKGTVGALRHGLWQAGQPTAPPPITPVSGLRSAIRAPLGLSAAAISGGIQRGMRAIGNRFGSPTMPNFSELVGASRQAASQSLAREYARNRGMGQSMVPAAGRTFAQEFNPMGDLSVRIGDVIGPLATRANAGAVARRQREALMARLRAGMTR